MCTLKAEACPGLGKGRGRGRAKPQEGVRVRVRAGEPGWLLAGGLCGAGRGASHTQLMAQLLGGARDRDRGWAPSAPGATGHAGSCYSDSGRGCGVLGSWRHGCCTGHRALCLGGAGGQARTGTDVRGHSCCSSLSASRVCSPPAAGSWPSGAVRGASGLCAVSRPARRGGSGAVPRAQPEAAHSLGAGSQPRLDCPSLARPGLVHPALPTDQGTASPKMCVS